MLVYDKIARYLDSSPDIIKFSLWKEKCRLIAKWFDEMSSLWYTYGIELLTHDLLKDFSEIYTNYIIQKENPNLVDVYNYNIPKIWVKDLYLCYIRNPAWILIAWWICSSKIIKGKHTFMLSFRAKATNDSFKKLHLWYYIEHMFFSHWISLWVDQFSRWKDTNGYGMFWSAVGVCIHKVQLRFLPYKSNAAKYIDVDEKLITRNSLFILWSDDKEILDKAILYLVPHDMNTPKYIEIVHVLEKRWFSVDVRSCS